MMNCLPIRAIILATLFLAAGITEAQPYEFVPTTVDGTVPGTTINYTITATGTAREIFGPGSSNSALFEWNNGFPEFAGLAAQTLTVDFSEPVPINRIALGVNSISAGPFTLTVTGGTATTADFTLTDGLSAVGGASLATYTAATGVFSVTGGDQSLIISGPSSNTLTQFSITGDGGGDGFTLFFGPTTTQVPVELQSFSIE